MLVATVAFSALMAQAQDCEKSGDVSCKREDTPMVKYLPIQVKNINEIDNKFMLESSPPVITNENGVSSSGVKDRRGALEAKSLEAVELKPEKPILESKFNNPKNKGWETNNKEDEDVIVQSPKSRNQPKVDEIDYVKNPPATIFKSDIVNVKHAEEHKAITPVKVDLAKESSSHKLEKNTPIKHGKDVKEEVKSAAKKEKVDDKIKEPKKSIVKAKNSDKETKPIMKVTNEKAEKESPKKAMKVKVEKKPNVKTSEKKK